MRIKQINRRLDKVRGQREQGRQSRRKATVPTVSLVGYTNAGKSTLFNCLTQARVYAAGKLFATLDPTLRKLALPGGLDLVLVDTVGFIRDLPHELVEAFRATLEETRDASLLLHVIDSADEGWRQRVRDVEAVLASIGAHEVPQILVFNKQDVIGGEPKIERLESGRVTRVWLSSKTGEGIELLQESLQVYFGRDRVHGWVKLPPRLGRMRAQLFHHRAVVTDQQAPDGDWLMEIDMDRRAWQALSRREKLPANTLVCQPQDCLAGMARAQ
jgi:GTP-binding protein HflX